MTEWKEYKLETVPSASSASSEETVVSTSSEETVVSTSSEETVVSTSSTTEGAVPEPVGASVPELVGASVPEPVEGTDDTNKFLEK